MAVIDGPNFGSIVARRATGRVRREGVAQTTMPISAPTPKVTAAAAKPIAS